MSALREGTKRLFVRMPPKLMACVRASARIYGKIDALLVARAAPGSWRRKAIALYEELREALPGGGTE